MSPPHLQDDVDGTDGDEEDNADGDDHDQENIGGEEEGGDSQRVCFVKIGLFASLGY